MFGLPTIAICKLFPIYIYNKKRFSVKHNIHIINIFIDLGLHVSIHLESSTGPL